MNMPDSLSIEADPPIELPRSVARGATPDEMFDAHFEAVYRYFSRRVPTADDAQDLTSETFAAVLERRCPRGVEPLCWLYGIARRKLADSIRRRKAEARRLGRVPQPIAPTTESGLELRRLVDALPDDQREALLLQALEDLSIQEIAQVMGRSAGSVKALLQRAKERVRRESAGRFDPEVTK